MDTYANIKAVALPAPELLRVLLPAYACVHFGSCHQARFEPLGGFFPRGFLGATRNLSDVEVILVLAEPGTPHSDEHQPLGLSSEELLKRGLQKTYEKFSAGSDPFHRNVRSLLDGLWPNTPFDEQLARVWITESRLCSLNPKNEIGRVRRDNCVSTFLLKQFQILEQAVVLVFGTKAKERLRPYRNALQDRVILYPWALSPPGCNRPAARDSWSEVIVRTQQHLASRQVSQR